MLKHCCLVVQFVFMLHLRNICTSVFSTRKELIKILNYNAKFEFLQLHTTSYKKIITYCPLL